MPSRLPAPIDTILETVAASAFGRAAARIWNGTVFCALMLILIMRIAVAATASNAGRWTIAAIGLAAAISVGEFEYQLHYAGWTLGSRGENDEWRRRGFRKFR